MSVSIYFGVEHPEDDLPHAVGSGDVVLEPFHPLVRDGGFADVFPSSRRYVYVNPTAVDPWHFERMADPPPITGRDERWDLPRLDLERSEAMEYAVSQAVAAFAADGGRCTGLFVDDLDRLLETPELAIEYLARVGEATPREPRWFVNRAFPLWDRIEALDAVLLEDLAPEVVGFGAHHETFWMDDLLAAVRVVRRRGVRVHALSYGDQRPAGARQHGTHFLLTEHNLYARDTINHLLERSMDTPVTRDEWRTLDRYETSAMVPESTRVTARQRAWMAWWAHTGLIAYRSADLITYLYPDAIEEAAGLGGDPAKSIVLANGVTPSDFDAARAVFDDRRAQVRGMGEDRIWRLAYAARVVPIKGLLDLLEALALLVAHGVDNWELDVMGPDEEMPDYADLCRRTCHDLGLDGHVKFFGSVNLRERFGNYDALVLPSHNEGQPIVVLEAMTIGLPTIGTYVGGMKQLVEDPVAVENEHAVPTGVVDSCGLLVHAHDIEGMAGAIKRLMADESLFDRLSENARARVDHYFHIDTAMALYRAVYRRFGSVPEEEFLEDLPVPLPLTGQPLPEVVQRPVTAPTRIVRRAA